MHTPLIGLPLFPTLGPWELIIVGAVVVLLFGATKLPKLGKGLGEGIRNFKSGLKSGEEGVVVEKPDADDEDEEKANGA
jgi:sec-independent protein translocase protein TatA